MSDMMLRQARQSQDSISHQILTKGKLPKDWVVRKVGDVSSFVRKSNKHIDIPYVGLEDIESNTGSFLGSFEPRVVKSNTYFFEPNQILYGRLRPYLNKVMLPDFIGHCSTEIFPISVNKELVYPKYVFRWLMSFWIVDKINETTTGARMPRANPKDIVALEIPIPPLETQKKIVAVLDKAFAAIDLAKTNIEKNLQNAKELFQSKLNQIFTQKGEGWEEKKLGDDSLFKIIDGDRGKNYPKKSDFFPEGHCVFMNTGNVRPNGFDFSTVMFITEKRDNLLRKGKLQRDDVVMTTRGTIGNLGWFNGDVKYEEIRINSGMLIFRVNQEKILPEYLFAVLRSPVVTKQIEEMTSGAAQPQLPIKTLVHFDIPFHPDLDTQRMMVGRIQELEFMTDDLNNMGMKKLRSLDELKKSILQKAFAGELL